MFSSRHFSALETVLSVSVTIPVAEQRGVRCQINWWSSQLCCFQKLQICSSDISYKSYLLKRNILMRMSVEMTSEGSFLFSNFLENYKDFSPLNSPLKIHFIRHYQLYFNKWRMTDQNRRDETSIFCKWMVLYQSIKLWDN